MDLHLKIVICVVVAFLLLVFHWNIKEKAYRKGFSNGEKYVTKGLIDTATWFGPTKPIIYNCLTLFALRYQKYGHVNSDRFRSDFNKLDNTKRIHELSQKELDELI